MEEIGPLVLSALIQMAFMSIVIAVGYVKFKTQTNAALEAVSKEQEDNLETMRSFKEDSISAIRELSDEVKELREAVNQLKIELAYIRGERSASEKG